MPKKINITITGAFGRMGQILIKCLLKKKNIQIILFNGFKNWQKDWKNKRSK